MADIEGTCHCGAIKLRIVGGFGENAKAVLCHCKDCQVLAGSLFAYVTGVEREKLLVIQGEPRFYQQRAGGGSGKPVLRYFCGDCGTPLWAESQAMPHLRSVKLSLFDGVNLEPGTELFWRDARNWEVPVVPRERVFNTAPGA